MKPPLVPTRPFNASVYVCMCVCVCARERERFQEGERTEVAILSLAAPLNQSESCRELVEPHHRIDVNRDVRLVVGLCLYVY